MSTKKNHGKMSFDEACRFPVEFKGEIGSLAHKEHHLTLMAKLGAKAFVAEQKAKRDSERPT